MQGLEGHMLDNLSEQTTAQKTAQETQQLRKQGQSGVQSLLAAVSRGTGRLDLGIAGVIWPA